MSLVILLRYTYIEKEIQWNYSKERDEKTTGKIIILSRRKHVLHLRFCYFVLVLDLYTIFFGVTLHMDSFSPSNLLSNMFITLAKRIFFDDLLFRVVEYNCKIKMQIRLLKCEHVSMRRNSQECRLEDYLYIGLTGVIPDMILRLICAFTIDKLCARIYKKKLIT